MTELSPEPGLSEGRVQISALGPPPPVPSQPRWPRRSRSAGRSRPLNWTPGPGRLSPIPLRVQPPRAPQAPATLSDPAAAHIPRTPDAGAAGSPSGGGLLPRSPSRDVPPALEVASAMASAGQVRGYGRPERLGAAGSSGRCSRGASWRWRQRPRPPAPAAVPACPSAASRLRPRGTSILLLVPAHVALGFSTPPVLFSRFRSRPPTSLSAARLRPHRRCSHQGCVPARVQFWVSSPPVLGLDSPPSSLSFLHLQRRGLESCVGRDLTRAGRGRGRAWLGEIPGSNNFTARIQINK